MTDTVTLAIVAGIPSVTAAILSFLNNLSIRKHELKLAEINKSVNENTELTANTSKKMDDLEENTNSKMDLLLKVKSEAEFAKGKLQGGIDERASTLSNVSAGTNVPADTQIVEAFGPKK
jgi:hypothetical protein